MIWATGLEIYDLKKVISRAHENAIVKIPDGYVLLNNYLARMKNYIREVSESSKNI